MALVQRWWEEGSKTQRRYKGDPAVSDRATTHKCVHNPQPGVSKVLVKPFGIIG